MMPASPASAPEIAKVKSTSLSVLKPEKRAARGAAPTTRISNPLMVRPRSTVTSITTTRAMIEPACNRPVPSNKVGTFATGSNAAVVGKVQALRIAPGAADQIVHAEIGDIDQHQAGEDFAGAEAHPADRRNQPVQGAAECAQDQHDRQHPMPDIGAVSTHGEPAAAHGADHKLPLGADIPDIGDVTQRETDRDHHQRRRLHHDFLK